MGETVDGYLLDNNVISILVRPGDHRHSHIASRLDTIRACPIFLPVIAIAEIEYGMAKAVSSDEQQRVAVRKFFTEYPNHLGVDDHTVEPYAQIRAQLWRMYGTKRGRGHREKLPEELVHRESGKLLGIDERDLLIASIAVQYNLILATCDKNPGMRNIEEAASTLEANGNSIRLRVSYW